MPVTAVVLRQRSVDSARPAVRPHSGIGAADLGVSATGVLYAAAAAASRGSSQSVQLSSGELLTYCHSIITSKQCKLVTHYWLVLSSAVLAVMVSLSFSTDICRPHSLLT